ncbi:unnamed protein product [Prorocentrum cordatum]|uniref:Uncharacterized protein n=1 Tax=Prorocentrum cordatum TaxID=2364126 RepID=A0ABN9RGR1_9DINO|nr:unnamed protein product [Polarella glacialis]
MWNSKAQHVEAAETAQASLTLGVCWSLTQQLGALGQLRIDWPSEVNSLIVALTTLVAFDFTPLQMNCSGIRDDKAKYLALILVPFFFAITLILWWGAGLVYQKIRRCPGMSFAHTVNSWGLIMQAMFVTVALASISPFRCESHPNGVSTVLHYPGVMCQGTEYTIMLTLSVSSTLLFVVGPTAACMWCIAQAPRRFAVGQDGFWVATRFLF